MLLINESNHSEKCFSVKVLRSICGDWGRFETQADTHILGPAAGHLTVSDLHITILGTHIRLYLAVILFHC